MDAFYASVEQRDHPEWRGKPVIVGAPPDRRGVVCTASYEARRFGVHSAMPSRTAGRLCPDGVFVRPDMERYRAESRRIMKLLHETARDVEEVSVDEAYLDATPRCPDLAHARRLAADLKMLIHTTTGLTASIGAAPNKFLAKLASDLHKPDGLAVFEAATAAETLRPLPVERIWGVGKRTAEILRRAGIATIGALQDHPGDLRPLVGGFAFRLRDLAFGRDDRPLETGGGIKSIGSEETFDHDTRSLRLIRESMFRQCEDVARRLRQHRLTARTVQIKLRFADFQTITRQATLDTPVQEEGALHHAAWRLALRERGRGKALRLAGVSCHNLQPEGLQPGLFDNDNRWTRAMRAVDAVRDSLGPESVRRNP